MCVCELPPAEPSACDDVSLGFDGALTDKYGGSEACSILVPAWSVKTGITAQQMCQVPLTQFVDVLDGAWVPPPGTAADAKVHDFCKMTCGLEALQRSRGLDSVTVGEDVEDDEGQQPAEAHL